MSKQYRYEQCTYYFVYQRDFKQYMYYVFLSERSVICDNKDCFLQMVIIRNDIMQDISFELKLQKMD
jgi:hypothetical protein